MPTHETELIWPRCRKQIAAMEATTPRKCEGTCECEMSMEAPATMYAKTVQKIFVSSSNGLSSSLRCGRMNSST